MRAFLDANLPETANRNDPRFIAEWNKKVREKRWVGFSWPKEVVCGSIANIEQSLLNVALARADVLPVPGGMGLLWVGPAIIQYGTEAQKQRFIPDILDGAYQWCTGYSEPSTGSDLASLSCTSRTAAGLKLVGGKINGLTA